MPRTPRGLLREPPCAVVAERMIESGRKFDPAQATRQIMREADRLMRIDAQRASQSRLIVLMAQRLPVTHVAIQATHLAPLRLQLTRRVVIVGQSNVRE
ncbi:hypothetical protein QCE83_26545 [Caballeronia sp. LZ034LL]|nr:hypothetical protein [Caballeronia sp. LZ034LL]MDR5837792.1 hypothetical protein [Caballeronia sp. LZ034LL]